MDNMEQEVPQEEQTNAVAEGAEQVEQAVPEAVADEQEVDDRGVPLKNVVAELQRKLEAADERLRRFEEVQPQHVLPQVAQPQIRKKSREEILAEINEDPEGYFERKVEETLRAEPQKQ